MVSSTLGVSRRRFLGGVATSAVVGAGLAALPGCTADRPGSPGGPAGPTAKALPTYRPFEGVTADLPGNDAGLMPTFLSYPNPPVPFAADGLLEGASVSAMVMGNSMPLVPADKNSFWQELNKKLGGTISVDVPPSAAEYQSKFSVRMAGGDLPDIFNVRHRNTPQLGGLLESRCQDLTEFLAGDKVLDYPALANLPTESWRAMTHEGRLYGWPYPQASLGNALIVRDDLRSKVGSTGEITTGEDFLELCRSLTDAKQNRWAATQPAAMVAMFQEMLGAPNQWKVEAGRFTHLYETPETETALDLVQKMWAEGLFDPDAYGNTLSPYRTLATGRIAMMYGGWQQWPATIRDNRPLDAEYGASGLALPKYDGGGLARKHVGTPAMSMICISRTDDAARIQQLLKVADFFAAPFGTDAFKFCRFGLPEIHHTEQNGIFTYTEKGTAEVVGMPKDFIGTSGTIANWQPMGMRDELMAVHEYQTQVMTDPLRDPSVGLYSSTDTTKGATLTVLMADHVNAIIQGRQPLSSWKDKVDEWRKSGGDDIRAEYEQSLEKSGGE